jgi:hypothetical protein
MLWMGSTARSIGDLAAHRRMARGVIARAIAEERVLLIRFREDSRAAVVAADDMVDLEGDVRCLLVEAAIFTASAHPFAGVEDDDMTRRSVS